MTAPLNNSINNPMINSDIKSESTKAADTNKDCPWLIKPLAGTAKQLTEKQNKYNLLIELLYLDLDRYKKCIMLTETTMVYYEEILLPLEDEYHAATQTYIKALHGLFRALFQMLDAKSCFEPAHYIGYLFCQQIRIYFKDLQIPEDLIMSLLDLPHPLDLKKVATKLFKNQKVDAFYQLYHAGIYVDYEVLIATKTKAEFEKLIQNLISNYYIDSRSINEEKWPTVPMTASLLRSELHRLHTLSLRKLQCRDITWKLHNFILQCYNKLKDPENELKKKLTKKIGYGTTDVAEYQLNWEIEELITYQAQSLQSLLEQDLILDKDMTRLNDLIRMHIALLRHLSEEYAYTCRYFLPLIDPDNHDELLESEGKGFLLVKARYLKQKTDFKKKASQALLKCNRESVEFLKVIFGDPDKRQDLYEKFPIMNDIQPTRDYLDYANKYVV